MQIEVFLVDAFTTTIGNGNPAAVVFDGQSYNEQQMQDIASRLGVSETVFVFLKTGLMLRYFTPENEVNLCGHATIAAFSLLLKQKMILPGTHQLNTKAGLFEVVVEPNGRIAMEQACPVFGELLERDEVARALNIKPMALFDVQLPQVVSTGLPDIIVGLNNDWDLQKLAPDMEQIKELSHKYQTIGLHVFAFNQQQGSGILGNCRNFAPLYGIPEEAATGTANAALACYLFRCGVLNNRQLKGLTFRQGVVLERPSEIVIDLLLDNDNHHICQVKVIGQAILNSSLILEF